MLALGRMVGMLLGGAGSLDANGLGRGASWFALLPLLGDLSWGVGVEEVNKLGEIDELTGATVLGEVIPILGDDGEMLGDDGEILGDDGEILGDDGEILGDDGEMLGDDGEILGETGEMHRETVRLGLGLIVAGIFSIDIK